jgi:hypothetical protein
MVHLANTHPAFKRPDAGRYAYNDDRPAWCVYEVLRDIGLRCVTGSVTGAGTGAGGAARPFCVVAGRVPCPLSHREWLFRNDVTYTEVLRELRLHLRLQRAACWP